MVRSDIVKIAVLALLLVCVGVTVWKWSDWRATALAGSAYAARVTCACRYIERRDAKSCAIDVADDAGMVRISVDDAAKRVSGSVPLLGSASARFTPGFGCLIEP